MRRLFAAVRALRDSQQGTALMEFALALPILLTMFIGVVEISRFVLFQSKLESVALQALDVTNQNVNVNATSLNNLFAALPAMMEPYDLSGVSIVLTQAVRPAHPTKNCKAAAAWQYPSSSGSRSVEGARTFPVVDTKKIQLTPNDSVLALEITTIYRPLVDSNFMRDLIGDFRIYHLGYARARYGAFMLHPVTGRKITVPCI